MDGCRHKGGGAYDLRQEEFEWSGTHNHKEMKKGIQTMRSIFNLVGVCAIAMLLLSNAAFAMIATSSTYTPRSDGNAYC